MTMQQTPLLMSNIMDRVPVQPDVEVVTATLDGVGADHGGNANRAHQLARPRHVGVKIVIGWAPSCRMGLGTSRPITPSPAWGPCYL